MCVSVFTLGVLIKDEADEKQAKLSDFARYDMFNPFVYYDYDADYTGSVPTIDETFITAGLDFAPIPNVRIIPNIWCNVYNNKHPDASGKLKADNALVARLTVYYIFW
ncbi:MAG: hypothetical protein SH856_01485 [Flavobacteriales bacterium]|nr:hypothetical protein [Flavobacteriales bacterium]